MTALPNDSPEENLNCTQFSRSTLEKMAFSKDNIQILGKLEEDALSQPNGPLERQAYGGPGNQL